MLLFGISFSCFTLYRLTDLDIFYHVIGCDEVVLYGG
jgi:hypothetical protein